MVGKSDGRSSVFGGSPAEPIDSAGSIQERIFGVNVKMDELFQLLTCLT
jgi:hypothetical protein